MANTKNTVPAEPKDDSAKAKKRTVIRDASGMEVIVERIPTREEIHNNVMTDEMKRQNDGITRRDIPGFHSAI